MENLMHEKSRLLKALFVLTVIVAVYFSVRVIAELKEYQFIGGGAPASNVISFNGQGEVSAVPDLATVSFTLRASEKVVSTAQEKIANKEKKVLDFLDTQGIDKKDIKTQNYSSYPKYEWKQAVCPPPGITEIFCLPGENVLVGYEVSENISVKIRDLEKVGAVVAGLGSIGVDQMNGPNFSIDDEDGLEAEARKLAIKDARAKAEALASDLGVRLVRIVSFSESGGYPEPYYARGATALDYAETAQAPTPELPTGENTITSNVNITYEIR
jgi:uncharacterized protein